MSAPGPVVTEETQAPTPLPKVKEISMKDFISSMQRTDAAYAQNYADLHEKAEVDLVAEFQNLFIAESTAPAPVAPTKPTEPVKPVAPSLGVLGMVGYAKPDAATLELQATYAREKAEYDRLKAEYDKQEPLYQQAKAKYDAEHAGYKAFRDGVNRTFREDVKGRQKLTLRPTEDEIKEDTHTFNSASRQWRVEGGEVSKFHAQKRAEKNDFTRPIVNGYKVKTRSAADEHYASERARLSKVSDFKADPRQVAYDMKQATAKSAAIKVEEKKEAAKKLKV